MGNSFLANILLEINLLKNEVRECYARNQCKRFTLHFVEMDEVTLSLHFGVAQNWFKIG